jgi:hypothetical protein
MIINVNDVVHDQSPSRPCPRYRLPTPLCAALFPKPVIPEPLPPSLRSALPRNEKLPVTNYQLPITSYQSPPGYPPPLAPPTDPLPLFPSSDPPI